MLALPEGADLLIVAAPGEANLQAIVFILDAEAVAHRLLPVGKRQRVLALVGEVDDGSPEDRPVAAEQDAAGKAQLFRVAQILDRRVDVPVERR